MQQRLFTGGYAGPGEEGLSVYEFNQRDGSLKLISSADAGINPSFFCLSAERGVLYVVNEVMEVNGIPGGGITTLKYDPAKGSVEKLGEFVVPGGGPCFVSLSHDRNHLFVANYPEGSVAVIKLGATGIPEKTTQFIVYDRNHTDGSHAHMIKSDPQGKYVYVTDLGLDIIVKYEFDPVAGRLTPVADGHTLLPAGSGPRHFVFNDAGSKMYLINELASTVMVFDTRGEKSPSLLQTLSTVREGFSGTNACADIHTGKNGKFLYGSNRGENTIVTYAIGDDGLLTLAGHTQSGGNWPRNFVIDPSGRFLLVANQRSDEISVFRIDPKTGLPAEPAVNFKNRAPSCLKFN